MTSTATFNTGILATGMQGNAGIQLTLSQTSPGFYVSAVQVFCKHCGKGGAISHFPTLFSNHLKNSSAIFVNCQIVVCKFSQFRGV